MEKSSHYETSTELAIAADVAAGGAHGVTIVGDVARGRRLRHREGGVVRQLTNQRRAFRLLTNERRALRLLTNERRLLPGRRPLVHPGWEARGMRKESLPGSSWAPAQAAARAGPPWCSDRDSHKPPHDGGGRQIHLR